MRAVTDTDFGSAVYEANDVVAGPAGKIIVAQASYGSIINVSGNTTLFGSSDPQPGRRNAASDGPSLWTGLINAYSLVVSKQGHLFMSSSTNRIVRIGTLAGAACLLSALTTVCAPGTFIDWDSQTCLPCPEGASTSGYAYSSYCVDVSGRVIPTVGPPPQVSPAVIVPSPRAAQGG